MTPPIHNTLVSIVIPCYNVEDYILECVESCMAQTHQHLQVICVNNNSTDKTLDILHDLRESHGITVLEELQKGAPSARNKGLSEAKGEWIEFLDADDLILPEKIEHQLKLIAKHPETDVIAAASYRRFVDGTEVVFQPESSPLIGILKSNFGNTCSNFWRHSKLKEAGGWNLELTSSQEYDLLFKLLKSNSTFLIDTIPLTIARNRESGQITKSNPTKKWYNYAKLRCEILVYLKASNHPEYLSKSTEIDNIVFDQIRVLAKYDLNLANQLYKSTFKNFTPQVSEANSPAYIKSFKLVGFKGVEKFKKLVRKG